MNELNPNSLYDLYILAEDKPLFVASLDDMARECLFNATSNHYSRAKAYPSLQDQADMQFHDLANGTTTWLDAIQAVKDAYPKPV